jgi:hypothetical protein
LRPSHLVAALILTVTSLSMPPGSRAQDVSERPAEIRTGSCASIGDVVVALDSVVAPAGDQPGPDGAMPVAQSVTVVPQLLPDLLAGGFIVVVEKSIEEPGTPAACGVVGGAVTEDGTLAVGLSPVNGSRLDGVAYFAPKRDDGGTTVTLLMVDNQVAEAASAPAGPVGRAGEDGMITIGGITEQTDSVSFVEDGSGPPPATDAAVAPAPDTGEKTGKKRKASEGESAVDSASGADTQDGEAGAEGKGGKEGKKGKGGRGGKDGNGGNAGNDGAASADG